MLRTLLALLLLGLPLAHTSLAQSFKFPDEDSVNAADDAARKAKLQALLATPCRQQLKHQKIMVLIAENRNGVIHANQSSYNAHINAINDGLKALGLTTYTQEQIRRQVAQAEIDAYFKNDADAALSASKRLAANYVLRGLIDTHSSRNLVANLNQIDIHMAFTLSGADGRVISQTSASNASYAGSDVTGMALTLVRESAEDVVATLYSDYCKSAGKR